MGSEAPIPAAALVRLEHQVVVPPLGLPCRDRPE